MTPKEQYRELCLQEQSIPIFSRDWFLDASSRGRKWDVALCFNNNHEIIASMPYVITKKHGLTRIGQPMLTPFLGPWLAPMKGSHSKKLSKQKELIQDLISQLPPYDDFKQNWHPSLTNWLPAYWKGFSQTTRYTYTVRLESGVNSSGLFTSNMRNKVRKAEKIVNVANDLPLNEFFELNRKTFLRQGLSTPYSFEFVKSFDDELEKRQRRKIFFAVDAGDNIHSALYLMWDNTTAYVHMVGEDPELRSSGAGILLIKHAIDFVLEKGLKVFDFEGSMIEGVEIVRRSCGGIQTPYHSISHTPSKLLRSIRAVKGLMS